MNVREVMREKERAKKFWSRLSSWERNEIGDQLVLGDFDWRDWMDKKPSRVFMNELDEVRILWEIEASQPTWSKVFG